MAIEWREIVPGYMVSSGGDVTSNKRSGLRILRPTVPAGGYLRLKIFTNGRPRRCSIHRLVAEAFLPPKPTPAHEINHKDGNKTNNRVENLEWVTKSQNIQHRFAVLHQKALRGESLWQTKLSEKDVIEIRARIARGEVHRHIANGYGVSRECVSRIADKRNWAWLKSSQEVTT